MGKKTDTLILRLETDGAGKIRASLQGAGRELERTGKQLGGTNQQLVRMRTLVAAVGSAAVIKGIVSTIVEFERLGASLVTVTGSAEEAQTQFDALKQFAAETPFQVQEVVDSFIKLKALGLDPSIESLRSYGNTASATGKSLNQFIEAVADAATGEFERLKEFGIKARKQGDQVSLTFQGVTTTVADNAAAIEGYLRRIGDEKFGDAMQLQMDTLGGAFSNLQDAGAQLAEAIGEAGLTTVLNGLASAMTWAAEKAKALLEAMSGTAEDLSFTGGFVGGALDRIKELGERADEARKKILELQAKGTLGTGISGFLSGDTSRREQVAELERQIRALRFQIRNEAANAARFAQDNGTVDNPANNEAARKAAAQAAAELTKQIEAQQKRINAIYQATLTPQQRFIQQTQELESLLSAGLDEGTYLRALAKYRDQLIGAGGAADESKQKIMGLFQATRTPQEQFIQKTRELDELLKRGLDEDTYQRALIQYRDALIGTGEAADDTKARIERLYEATRTPQERFIQQTRELDELLKAGLDEDIYKRALAKYRDELIGMGEDGKKTFNELQKATEKWGEQFTGTLADMVTKGKLDFKSLADSILNDLARIAIRNTITKPILSSLGESFPSIFGGGKAHGGAVSSGVSYLVGERGPELFTPRASGNITPNDKLGGQTLVQVINQGPVPAETQQLRTPDGGEMIRVFVRAVADDISRGGLIARAAQNRWGLVPQGVAR